jgi:hypothetical protein
MFFIDARYGAISVALLLLIVWLLFRLGGQVGVMLSFYS